MVQYLSQNWTIPARRRRGSLVAISAILFLLILSAQYITKRGNLFNIVLKFSDTYENEPAYSVKKAVKFMDAPQRTVHITVPEKAITISQHRLDQLTQASRGDRASVRREINSDMDYEMSVFQIQSKVLFIPGERWVHFDLKGAPPLLSYLEKVFRLIKTLGATGILLEYEDMFPFSGSLSNIAAGNCYTAAEITVIVEIAKNLQLEVIPLVQTFGHMEFALKHQKWSRLREVSTSPQALCPSRNGSLNLVAEIIEQVLNLHPDIKYLHIGCDEVFQIGECSSCRNEDVDSLFLRHVTNVWKIVHRKRPQLRVLMWDDMLRRISDSNLVESKLGDIVEPMVWVYVDEIHHFVQPHIWEKYARIFGTVWVASAFKGAFGETLSVPPYGRHLSNNLRWLETMSAYNKRFRNNISGIALTGWQRYDHFAVLCELLPAALPSLAFSLATVRHGLFNNTVRRKALTALSCPAPDTNAKPTSRSKIISSYRGLKHDPYMWNAAGRCMFPGSGFFRLTYRLHAMEQEVDQYVRATTRSKGWMTAYNVRTNFSSPLRVEELTADLARLYQGTLSLIRPTIDSLSDVFDKFTIAEWIEQKIYPYVVQLERLQNDSLSLKRPVWWPSRPLPPLADLTRLGVEMP